MANELKMPHVVVALIYMVAQAVIVMGYISWQSYGYTFLLCMVLLLGVVYICFMKKYFALHQPV